MMVHNSLHLYTLLHIWNIYLNIFKRNNSDQQKYLVSNFNIFINDILNIERNSCFEETNTEEQHLFLSRISTELSCSYAMFRFLLTFSRYLAWNTYSKSKNI